MKEGYETAQGDERDPTLKGCQAKSRSAYPGLSRRNGRQFADEIGTKFVASYQATVKVEQVGHQRAGDS